MPISRDLVPIIVNIEFSPIRFKSDLDKRDRSFLLVTTGLRTASMGRFFCLPTASLGRIRQTASIGRMNCLNGLKHRADVLLPIWQA